MTFDQKTFAYDDVCKHNKIKDCWLIISGKVYDVSVFMNDHPGGDVNILAAAGRDATEDYMDIDHSDEAKKIMEKYYIGKIDESTLPVKSETKNSDNISQLIGNTLVFLAPFMVFGVAFAARAYTKENLV